MKRVLMAIALVLARMALLTSRAAALYQVRSLEITLAGQNKALAMVTNRDAWGRIFMARINTRRELAKARAHYISLLPPGQRLVFKEA